MILKKLLANIVVGFILIAPLISYGQVTTDDLVKRIEALRKQIEILQAELQTATKEVAEARVKLKFTRLLQRGATGDEVRALQVQPKY